MCAGQAGNAISILCTGQGTKNVLNGSAEPRYQMGHMKHKTKRNIFRHIQTEETVYVCEVSELAERRLCAQTETKQLEARQVM